MIDIFGLSTWPRRRLKAVGVLAALIVAASASSMLAQVPTAAQLKEQEEAKKKADRAAPKGLPPPVKVEQPVPKPRIVNPRQDPPVKPTLQTTPRIIDPKPPVQVEQPVPKPRIVNPRQDPPVKPILPTTPRIVDPKPPVKVDPLQRPAKVEPPNPANPTLPNINPKTLVRPAPAVIDQRASQPGSGAGKVPALVAPTRFVDIKQGRSQQIVSGNRTTYTEPGNRTIIKQDNRFFIRNDDSARFRQSAPNALTNRRRDGTVETVYVRPDGVRIVSIVDADGRVLRRTRRVPGGREIVLIDDRSFYRRGALIGAGALGIGVVAVLLARPVHAIPRAQYIVEYDRASDDEIYEAFAAPPVERLTRAYSLDEIRYSETLRERMRRVDLDSINFDTASWQIAPEQHFKLERMARAMERVLRRDPSEVFMIEGHTDAVGTAEDNISLSDRRAEAVAEILTSRFNIPAENLVTQGYGEQFLKVDTRDAERLNRRVATRRIGPLMGRSGAAQ